MPEDIDLSLLDPVLERYKSQGDALITMLQEAQDMYAYLPEQVLARLSLETKIALIQIYAVVTFYAQFYLTPRGRNTIRVCRGTACHVQGCDSMIPAVEDTLGVEEGETTDVLEISLETVACLGTCFLAPVMMVNESYHGKLDPQRAKTILAAHSRAGKES